MHVWPQVPKLLFHGSLVCVEMLVNGLKLEIPCLFLVSTLRSKLLSQNPSLIILNYIMNVLNSGCYFMALCAFIPIHHTLFLWSRHNEKALIAGPLWQVGLSSFVSLQLSLGYSAVLLRDKYLTEVWPQGLVGSFGSPPTNPDQQAWGRLC